MNSNLKTEILFEDGCGWYGYKPWGYAGEFLFKSYKADCALTTPVICNQWIRVSPFNCSSREIEYFDTKSEVEALI